MKAIITKQRLDGTFDEVGMNNRALISHLKSEHGVIKWAAGYACGRPHRIELFTNIYGEPYKTIIRG